MGSRYLQSADYAAYGLALTTTAAQVDTASTLIDAHLHRPEGLVYGADVSGNPVYMAGLTPSRTFRVPAGLAPGTNVTATITGPIQALNAGDVLIAERATPANTEPLVVSRINGNQVTFASVGLTHAGGVDYDAGLVITESKHLPSNRATTMLSKAPVVRLLSGLGRYNVSRRGRYGAIPSDDFNLVSIVAQFGPSQWEALNLGITDFDPDTGTVWIPSGLLGSAYSEVKFSYVAGFASTNIPEAIKQVAAILIKNNLSSPLTGNIKTYKAGDMQIERFLATVMGKDEIDQIRQFQARVYA